VARIPRRLPRDTILFFGGLSGIGYETLVGRAERPTLLILFGAMVGLPAFLRSDESKQDKKEEALDEKSDK
jgi:hypothetical protein